MHRQPPNGPTAHASDMAGGAACASPAALQVKSAAACYLTRRPLVSRIVSLPLVSVQPEAAFC